MIVQQTTTVPLDCDIDSYQTIPFTMNDYPRPFGSCEIVLKRSSGIWPSNVWFHQDVIIIDKNGQTVFKHYCRVKFHYGKYEPDPSVWGNLSGHPQTQSGSGV